MHSNTRSFQRARFEVWIVWKFGFELYFTPYPFSSLSSYYCQNLFSCGWHLFEEISFCMWHSVKGTNSTITALYWLFSVYERVKKWNLPKYDCLVLIIKDLKKDYDSHIAIYLWSKISFLRINVKLKVISEIVNKFLEFLLRTIVRTCFLWPDIYTKKYLRITVIRPIGVTPFEICWLC